MEIGGDPNPQSCPERPRMLPTQLNRPNTNWQHLSSSPSGQNPYLERRGYSDSTISGQFSRPPHSPSTTTHQNPPNPRYQRRMSHEGNWDVHERCPIGADNENSGPVSNVLVDRKRRLTAPSSPGRRGSGVEDVSRKQHIESMGERAGSSGGSSPANLEYRRIDEVSAGMGSRSTPIDLTGPDGSPVPRPKRQSQEGIRDRELVLPRWQSDSEVSTCPVCGTSFSFFFRKHHCRYVIFCTLPRLLPNTLCNTRVNRDFAAWISSSPRLRLGP